MNNIGTINMILSRTIGATATITDPTLLTVISGYADVGFIVFDNNGTMAVCTNFSRDAQDNPIYIFRTCSLNAEIDVQNILSQSY